MEDYSSFAESDGALVVVDGNGFLRDDAPAGFLYVDM